MLRLRAQDTNVPQAPTLPHHHINPKHRKRHYQYVPTFILRGLTELHLEFALACADNQHAVSRVVDAGSESPAHLRHGRLQPFGVLIGRALEPHSPHPHRHHAQDSELPDSLSTDAKYSSRSS